MEADVLLVTRDMLTDMQHTAMIHKDSRLYKTKFQ